MKEIEQPKNKKPRISFSEYMDIALEGYELRGGHGRRYRGKHRSATRGAGALAFFRSLGWQLISRRK